MKGPATGLSQRWTTLHCAECAGQWESPLPLPMDCDRVVKVLRAMALTGCPHCGAWGKAVLMGPTPPNSRQRENPP